MKLNGLEKYFKTVDGKIVDLNQIDNYKQNPLMYVIQCNKESKFNLNEEQWKYLLENTDLKMQDKFGYNVLMYVLWFNEKQDLKLGKENWAYLVQKTDISQIDYRKENVLSFALEHNCIDKLNQMNCLCLFENLDISKIKDENKLNEINKIKIELKNKEILSKIDIKKDINKKNNKI